MKFGINLFCYGNADELSLENQAYLMKQNGFEYTFDFSTSNAVSAETADYLAEKGCEVTIVEMTDKIANGESSTVMPTLMANYAKYGVKQLVNTKVSAIEEGKVVAVNTADNADVVVDCDYVVMAVGSKKNVLDVEGVEVPVYYAGDCAGERTADIASAIRGGYNAANEI